MVEHLPSKWEALGSIPSTTKKKQRGLLCSHNMVYDHQPHAGRQSNRSRKWGKFLQRNLHTKGLL